jgi:TonB family protein
MHEAVSDILVGRRQDADGLNRMVLVSLVAHGVLLTVLVLAPSSWWTTSREAPSTAITISLGGGAPGTDTGGMTQMADRPVQSVAPPEAKPVVTAPAAKVPEMVVPAEVSKPRTPTKPVEKPDAKSASRKPTSGPEVKPGAARIPTGGLAVPFGGLSTSGGGGTGGTRIVGDFCCPEYIETMNRLIYNNWNQQQGAPGSVDVRFTIRRDGMLTLVVVDKTSNNPLLDLESRRAVLVTKQLPPLPEKFTRPTLTVILTFEYKR